MSLRKLIRATPLLSLVFGAHVVQANHDEEVDAAVYILGDLEQYLAQPFCSDYIHYHEQTSTYTVTGQPITITKTVAPESCTETSKYPIETSGSASPITYSSGYVPITPSSPTLTNPTPPSQSPTSTHPTPWISTISSTTTLTYITTSTIYIGASALPQIALEKRSPEYFLEVKNIISQRDTWCSDYGVPCRLVVYTHDVVADACEKYLGGGEIDWRSATVWETVTRTMTGEGCRETGYSSLGEYEEGVEYEQPKYDDKSQPPANSGYEEEGPSYDTEHGDGGAGGGEDKNADPSDDLEFTNEYCYDRNC